MTGVKLNFLSFLECNIDNSCSLKRAQYHENFVQFRVNNFPF